MKTPLINRAWQPRLSSVTSRQNPLIKQLRRAFSHGEATSNGHVAVEGVHLIEEAIRSGLRLHAIFFSESAGQRAERLLPQVGKNVETLLLPDQVFASAVATEHPQGVAALVVPKKFELKEVAAPGGLLIVAMGIQDPGNLGTLLRSAEAFGASGLILTEGTVSAFNSKVIRASAGSLFRLPCVSASFAEALPVLRGNAIRIVATSSHKGTPLPQTDLKGGVALLIGNEGAGVPKEALAQADERIVIPHSANVESLNAGVAAAIILYEAARQRNQH
ncbi:MAG TPA: RNA methyltransferase [Terriglobales bacterium]|nr:RNA methyltransferase [Terriglobales bacterium]